MKKGYLILENYIFVFFSYSLGESTTEPKLYFS